MSHRAATVSHQPTSSMVTRIGAGPNGMTIRAGDAKDIDDYLAAR